MKHVALVFAIFISSLSFAQDSTQVEKAETPRIVSKLFLGERLQFDDVEFKFVEVLQDSRCPKDVTCIWAGEVVVLVDVFEHGKKTEQKKLTLSPTSRLQSKIGNLFSSDNLSISGLNVFPYPKSSGKPKLEDYYIQLEVSH